MSQSIEEAWEQAATDPNPNTDLGYELCPLTVVHVDEGGGKFMFLPTEEEHLHDEEFMIATEESVCRLDEYR